MISYSYFRRQDVQVSASCQAELRFDLRFNTPQVILISIGYSVNCQRTITQTIFIFFFLNVSQVINVPSLFSKGLIQQLFKLQMSGILLDILRKDINKARFCRVSIFLRSTDTVRKKKQVLGHAKPSSCHGHLSILSKLTEEI